MAFEEYQIQLIYGPYKHSKQSQIYLQELNKVHSTILIN